MRLLRPLASRRADDVAGVQTPVRSRKRRDQSGFSACYSAVCFNALLGGPSSLEGLVRLCACGEFGWIPKHFDRLAGTTGLREAIEAGVDPGVIVRGWEGERRRYLERRRAALLYPE